MKKTVTNERTFVFYALVGRCEIHFVLGLTFIGDNAFDLQLSDEGSVTEDTESEDEDEFDHHRHHTNSSASTSNVSLPVLHDADAQAEMEFQAEVKASLTRAFLEGHSVDNAAVELKTLRMASNVPLRRVRQAVVAGIVEQIPLVPTAPQQRKEIARVVDRWGDLITKIGGVDAVDTISILQVRLLSLFCARTDGVSALSNCSFRLASFMPLTHDVIWMTLSATGSHNTFTNMYVGAALSRPHPAGILRTVAETCSVRPASCSTIPNRHCG